MFVYCYLEKYLSIFLRFPGNSQIPDTISALYLFLFILLRYSLIWQIDYPISHSNILSFESLAQSNSFTVHSRLKNYFIYKSILYHAVIVYFAVKTQKVDSAWVVVHLSTMHFDATLPSSILDALFKRGYFVLCLDEGLCTGSSY